MCWYFSVEFLVQSFPSSCRSSATWRWGSGGCQRLDSPKLHTENESQRLNERGNPNTQNSEKVCLFGGFFGRLGDFFVGQMCCSNLFFVHGPKWLKRVQTLVDVAICRGVSNEKSPMVVLGQLGDDILAQWERHTAEVARYRYSRNNELATSSWKKNFLWVGKGLFTPIMFKPI